MITRACLVFVALSVVLACQKDGPPEISGSGALNEDEKVLLSHVPASANLIFGGRYDQRLLDYWDNSPLKKLTEAVAAAGGQRNAMRDYMSCWVDHQRDKGSELIGSLEISGGNPVMTMAFRGIDAKTLTVCSKKAGYKYEKSEDGKYIELDGVPTGLGTTTKFAYYFIDPQTIYFAMEMPIGMADPSHLPTPSRAELEKHLERAAADPASKSDKVEKLLEKADRSKSMWFSGSAEGTPAAMVLVGGHGWIDADKDSLTAAFSIELRKAEMADNAVAKFKEVKDNLDSLPPTIKTAAESFFENAQLAASGKTLRGRFRITNALIESIMPMMQGMAAGGM